MPSARLVLVLFFLFFFSFLSVNYPRRERIEFPVSPPNVAFVVADLLITNQYLGNGEVSDADRETCR